MYVGAHHTGFKGQLCGLSSPLPPFCGFSAQIQVARITLELTVQTRQASATLCAGIKDKHCHAQLVSLEPNTDSGMWAQAWKHVCICTTQLAGGGVRGQVPRSISFYCISLYYSGPGHQTQSLDLACWAISLALSFFFFFFWSREGKVTLMHLTYFMNMKFKLFRRVSCSPSWSQIHYVVWWPWTSCCALWVLGLQAWGSMPGLRSPGPDASM